jgi:hypothetical protein
MTQYTWIAAKKMFLRAISEERELALMNAVSPENKNVHD